MRLRNERGAADGNRGYHVSQLLQELDDKKWPNVHAGGYDTRNYLSIDLPECQILQELLEREIERLKMVNCLSEKLKG